MPQNLELKAAYPDLRSAAAITRHLGARSKGVLRQKDVYFDVPRGRLKLRIFNKKKCEFIAYTRIDRRGGRYSAYEILPYDDAEAAQKFCSAIFDTHVIVEKKRRLFLYKNARIHLDTVKGLGNFIEFEVVVSQGRGQARKLFQELVEAFHIRKMQTIEGSYSDLLEKKFRNGKSRKKKHLR
jgi:predicted adenylyl cyclase CyaB